MIAAASIIAIVLLALALAAICGAYWAFSQQTDELRADPSLTVPHAPDGRASEGSPVANSGAR